MIDEPAIGREPAPDRLRRLVSATRRAVSQVIGAFLLWGALVVWARIMGAAPFDGTTFAMATDAERVLMGVLAALLPLAALGMWFAQSWGRVVWIAVVALHCLAMLNGWAPGRWTATLLAFHGLSLGLFASIEILFVLDRSRRAG